MYGGLLGIFLDVDTLNDPSKNISFPQCYQEMVHHECFLNCSKTKHRQHELALLPGKIQKKSVGTGWKKLFIAQIADQTLFRTLTIHSEVNFVPKWRQNAPKKTEAVSTRKGTQCLVMEKMQST